MLRQHSSAKARVETIREGDFSACSVGCSTRRFCKMVLEAAAASFQGRVMSDQNDLRARAKFFLTLAQQARDGGAAAYAELLSQRATQLNAEADNATSHVQQQQQNQPKLDTKE